MKKQRAYKFRLYPDRQQEVLFHKTFGCCRFLYNRMLADKKEMYEKTGKTERLTPADFCRSLQRYATCFSPRSRVRSRLLL